MARRRTAPEAAFTASRLVSLSGPLWDSERGHRIGTPHRFGKGRQDDTSTRPFPVR
jgi:hypothetical protein